MVDIGYVYMLKCSNGKYYTGSTTDLDRRLAQHQEGIGANFTRKYLPFKLEYVETFERADLAFQREKQIQGWSHKKKKALIMSDFNSLRELSECKTKLMPTTFIPTTILMSQPIKTICCLKMSLLVVSTDAQRPTVIT